MTTESLKQKLTAILSADVKDYSRLMSQDRIGTVATLKSCRELITNLVKRYVGNVIDTPGDNILAAFDSVSDAVNCAVEIQRQLAERNAEVPSPRMMEWRIGISLGDVIEDEGRIYGDGVNIAARVESLAEPGSICVSGTVYDQVQDNLGLKFEYQGEKEVKNISRPIKIYSLLLKPKPKIEIEKEKSALPSEKPSIAVLPFLNMSNDPEQEYFSDGMAEEILNGLAKNPGLIVKARTSSFAFKDQSQDIRKIGEMLNATHIVEGSVRKSGNRIRITAQLINTAEDAHIWSDKYDRELTDVFDIQDEIAESILEQLSIHLLGSSEKSRPTTNMEAYNAFLLGRHQLSLGLFDEASFSFKKAINLDPNYPDAYVNLALTEGVYINMGFGSPLESVSNIRSNIEKAMSFDPDQGAGLRLWIDMLFHSKPVWQDIINRYNELVRKYPNERDILSYYRGVIFVLRQTDLSLKIGSKILEMDPLNAMVHTSHGAFFVWSDQLQEARKSFETAAQLGSNQAADLAYVAVLDGDVRSLKDQLDLGESNWGFGMRWYAILNAAYSYLIGDHKKVKENLEPFWRDTRYTLFNLKSWAASLEGNLDLALDYYTQAISNGEQFAFLQIHAPTHFELFFPEYRSHPKYKNLLKDMGLDDVSIAKLKIPPFPF